MLYFRRLSVFRVLWSAHAVNRTKDVKTRWIKKIIHDYDLVVTGGLTGLSMQLTGGFMEQYWGTYVPVCREVQEQAFQTADFIAEPDRRYGVRLNETLEYRGCKGILDYDRETRNRAQRDTHGALPANKEKRERLCLSRFS